MGVKSQTTDPDLLEANDLVPPEYLALMTDYARIVKQTYALSYLAILPLFKEFKTFKEVFAAEKTLHKTSPLPNVALTGTTSISPEVQKELNEIKGFIKVVEEHPEEPRDGVNSETAPKKGCDDESTKTNADIRHGEELGREFLRSVDEWKKRHIVLTKLLFTITKDKNAPKKIYLFSFGVFGTLIKSILWLRFPVFPCWVFRLLVVDHVSKRLQHFTRYFNNQISLRNEEDELYYPHDLEAELKRIEKLQNSLPRVTISKWAIFALTIIVIGLVIHLAHLSKDESVAVVGLISNVSSMNVAGVLNTSPTMLWPAFWKSLVTAWIIFTPFVAYLTFFTFRMKKWLFNHPQDKIVDNCSLHALLSENENRSETYARERKAFQKLGIAEPNELQLDLMAIMILWGLPWLAITVFFSYLAVIVLLALGLGEFIIVLLIAVVTAWVSYVTFRDNINVWLNRMRDTKNN